MKSGQTAVIACQGGGSHCAFGAGVLLELLGRMDGDGTIRRGNERLRVKGFSGTSGGAINAAFAWYAMVARERRIGLDALSGFWHGIMATAPWDAIGNAALVSAARLQGILPSVELAPNAISASVQEQFGELIGRYLPFDDLAGLANDDSPELHIGAANVTSGEFTVFGGPGRQSVPAVEYLLASAAVPELFPAVKVGEQYYWDGLLSQNPPIRNFLRGRTPADIPDQIWIVRINPMLRTEVPRQLTDIRDRRNEMAGNVALEEELHFVGQVNKWVAKGYLPNKKHVAVHDIWLERTGRPGDGFDYASKLDRRPGFIENLLARGREAAAVFLDGA
jgi:NTE family protein